MVVPAINKNAKIPDQLIKRLAGKTLIQRILDTAKEVADREDIFVITDSDEIALICSREGIQYLLRPDLHIDSNNIVGDLKYFFLRKSKEYENIILFRASTPLVNGNDIKKAFDEFVSEQADVLVTLRQENHNLWNGLPASYDELFFGASSQEVFVEIRAFIIIKSEIFKKGLEVTKVAPYYLGDRAIEINSYQDWWICEKLLRRKRILFVVAGYPAIGMGHIYRALTIAHEILDHQIMFLCTKESELAIQKIAEKEYRTYLQKSDDLASEVLDLEPDLVINDMLNTESNYIQSLKERGIKVVNFEDMGSGASATDITFNELFDNPTLEGENILWGNDYLFLRDEFLGAKNRKFVEVPKKVLITFGGTDVNNLTQKALLAIAEVCEAHQIEVRIVSGAGYSHQESLQQTLKGLPGLNVVYTTATSVISSIMEEVDLAISSNGRTVYELAHMNIPTIVFSQHARENTHDFATADHGFINLGFYTEESEGMLRAKFQKLVEKPDYRKKYFSAMEGFDFIKNKRKVLRKVLSLLN